MLFASVGEGGANEHLLTSDSGRVVVFALARVPFQQGERDLEAFPVVGFSSKNACFWGWSGAASGAGSACSGVLDGGCPHPPPQCTNMKSAREIQPANAVHVHDQACFEHPETEKGIVELSLPVRPPVLSSALGTAVRAFQKLPQAIRKPADDIYLH